jgi:uncharacterized membrane protein YoaK (UPF0700 family)
LAGGAIYGGILGSFISQPYLIAVIAALLAVVTATVLRYFCFSEDRVRRPPAVCLCSTSLS